MIELSEKDVSATLRLLKLLAGSAGEKLVRSLSDARDTAIGFNPPPSAQGETDWAPLARALFLGRRRRADHFAAAMIGEPAWDMLLALYMTERSESRMTISKLSEHSGAPMTTALRWIDYLEQSGLVVRRPKPTDRRAIFVELTTKGRDSLNDYFASLGSLGFDSR